MMKEFIDKLIGRLEELKTTENPHDSYYEAREFEKTEAINLTNNKTIKRIISIVNQLAEEYKHCTLCYLQSPCEYQNENVTLPASEFADDNGWIPCSSPLVPPDYCIVQIQEDNGYLWIPKVGEYRASTGKWRIEGAFEHSNGWLKDTEHFKVIAWQPLPAPYQPKGE